MKIVVTGGAGFIGSCFVRLLMREEPDIEVVNLDKLTYAGNLENLAPVAGNSRLPIRQRRYLRSRTGEQATGGCAAGRNAYISPPSRTWTAASSRRNRCSTPIWAAHSRYWNASAAQQIGRYVHVSTDEVYGSLEEPHEADENYPLQAEQPVFGGQGGIGFVGAGLTTRHTSCRSW